MRTVTPAAAAALASGHVMLVPLVEMDLSSPLYLNASPLDLDVRGTLYQGTRGLGKINAVADTPAEVCGLSFELSGVRTDALSLMLSEPVRGKAVRLKLAILNPADGSVLDVHQRWAGWLDVMSLSESGGTGTITVTAEHGGIDLTRPASSYYSDDEQQRLHPGDLFLQFMSDQVEQRITWPVAAWFRK